jgi:hypothetical protein
MIQNQHSIKINASPEKVFRLIETMPNKFPVYKILETKPFVFIRMLFTDGFSSAVKAMFIDIAKKSHMLNIGDSYGPFKLIEIIKPARYLFDVDSFFMKYQTGYILTSDGKNNTKLNFEITAGDLLPSEKVYWLFVKPIHHLLAKKALRVIKEKAENI